MGEAPKVGKVDPCQQSRSVTWETVFQRMENKKVCRRGFRGVYLNPVGVTLNPTCPENFNLINPKPLTL